MNEVINHLWQSTVFAGLVALLAYWLKNHQARTRYWLWMAASLKFVVPFALFLALGSRVKFEPVTPAIGAVTAVSVEQMTSTFAPVALPRAATQQASWPVALGGIWLLGVAIVIGNWIRQWWLVRRALAGAKRLNRSAPIPVMATWTNLEPGVFGIFKPVLVLPDGIASKLTEEELDAVLSHELTHVKRRDNLTAAMHMAVSALFWFHPLVWWIGGRLIEERERACDEAVLEEGKQALVYAQGILNVCKHYVESPLPCAAGVSGADLRKRIEEIMAQRTVSELGNWRKWALLLAMVAVVSLPMGLGLLRAQTLPPAPQYRFEVASIKKGDTTSQSSRIGPGPQGGLRTQNTTTMQLLTFAFDVRDYQVLGGPSWVRDERFDVTATPDTPEEAVNPQMGPAKMEALFRRHQQRMQALLQERFGLVLKAETREMSVYGLVVGKGGHKLVEATDQNAPAHLRTGNGSMSGNAIKVKMMTNSLSSLLGRPVLDETGLAGAYNFKMEWTPEGGSAETGQGSIFTAVQEQLGLKLESKKGAAPVYLIEKIERPTEN